MAVSPEAAAPILAKCARHCCVCRRFRPLHLQVHHIVERNEGGTEDGEERLANVQELRNKAQNYDELAPSNALAAFLEDVSLVQDVDQMDEAGNRGDAVTLITLHAAKGLEFPYVFLIGLEEGVLPHQRSVEDARQLEEERRLFYVAITRARDALYLTYPQRRLSGGYGDVFQRPSRFLQEIPNNLVEDWQVKRG